MQKLNLIDLQLGLNKIQITQQNVGDYSINLPVARLSKGKYIKNMNMKIAAPFQIETPFSNGIILYRFAVGHAIQDDYFVELTATNPDIQSNGNIIGANSGSYFDDPINFDTQLDIILKSQIISRCWSFTSPLNVNRYDLAGVGTPLATLSFGGSNGGYLGTTEEYDGTSWTISNDLNIARDGLAGAGTQSSALSFGGSVGSYNTTEEYDGVSWSVANVLNHGRYGLAGAGTQSDAFSFGAGACEKYDGTDWTVVSSENVYRYNMAGAGTPSAALSFGGQSYSNVYLATTEEYNGTSWFLGNDLNTTKTGLTGTGTQNAALSFGGQSGVMSVWYIYYATTEEYDGVDWAISNDLNQTKRYGAGAGSQSNTLAFGGDCVFNLTNCEEYNTVDFSTTTRSGNMLLNIAVY